MLYFLEYQEYPIMEYACVYGRLRGQLNIVRTSKVNSFYFMITGVLYLGDQFVFVFPKGYDLKSKSDEERKTEAKLVLSVLMRYRHAGVLSAIETQMLHGSTETHPGRLTSALPIIEDFRARGLLKRWARTLGHKAQGAVDWGRTVAANTPIHSKGNPIYVSFTARYTYNDTEHLITRIHRYIVTDGISRFGWLLGWDVGDRELSCDCPCSQEEAIFVLHKELRNTFVERETYVIKNMIQYLKGAGGSSSKESIELLATPYFQNTWEAMCSAALNNQYAMMTTIVPRPQWASEVLSKPKLSQRPDILYTYKGQLFIVDAKYYDYWVSRPGWHDIVKQLFYSYTIQRRSLEDPRLPSSFGFDPTRIRNYFLLPENSQKRFVELGTITVEGVSDLGEITVIALSVREIMKDYANRVSDPSPLRELLMNC